MIAGPCVIVEGGQGALGGFDNPVDSWVASQLVGETENSKLCDSSDAWILSRSWFQSPESVTEVAAR